MKFKTAFAGLGLLAMLGAGAAIAQTAIPKPVVPAKPAVTAPAVTAPAKPVAAAPAKADRTAVSKACSAQADTKGLHGKERKKFRDDCKKAGKKN